MAGMALSPPSQMRLEELATSVTPVAKTRVAAVAAVAALALSRRPIPPTSVPTFRLLAVRSPGASTKPTYARGARSLPQRVAPVHDGRRCQIEATSAGAA